MTTPTTERNPQSTRKIDEIRARRILEEAVETRVDPAVEEEKRSAEVVARASASGKADSKLKALAEEIKASKKEKLVPVTGSVPEHVVKALDKIADAAKTTRSKALAMILEKALF